MNILILTRIANKNGNSIYNSYTQGITNNYPNAIVMDYFDLYFEKGKSGFEQTILEQIETHDIDLIFINFVSGDLTFDIIFLEKLSQHCFIVMNFYDGELFFEPIDRYYAQCADVVLIPASSCFTYNYKLLGINAISTLSFFDSHLYTPKVITKDIDISFVGDVSKKSRQDFINFLIEKGYAVEVFGKNSQHGSVSFDTMIDIFNRSKINLNFSDTIDQRNFNTYTNTNYSIVKNIVKHMNQLKGRSIEVALCKGFVLTQHATGIEELFTKDEIDTFNSKEELLQKVQYYLAHNKKREEKAANAYKMALTKFDATTAFSKIFQALSIQERAQKNVLLDQDFISNYTTYHLLYFFNFFFKLRFNHLREELTIITAHPINLKMTWYYLRQQFKYFLMRTFSG
jgi:hypothetical protein